jgi:hypothetical protein
MESQDDPEKRIRDLERPLADAARASELGGAPQGSYPPPPPGPVPPQSYAPPPSYGSVPPPPMYGYGSPYGGPAPKSSSGRLWWIVGTIIVIAVLALAGGIAAFAAHQLSSVRSSINSPTYTTLPTAPSRTTTRSPRPSTSPTRSPTTTSSVPPSGAPISVSGIDENQTIACNDNVVTVSGINNTIVITGHCVSVTVSGMKNKVTVDSSDTIEASGMNNHVTFHSGAPKVSKSGVDNVVEQG